MQVKASSQIFHVDLARFRQSTWRSLSERVIESGLIFCSLVSVLTTIGIVVILFWESSAFFNDVSVWQFIADTEWTPLFAQKHFGIWPLLAGTFLTSGIALMVAVPLGIGAAIYLSEFASRRMRQILKPALELLAGVPTVVFGYFALVVVTPLLQKIIPGLSGFNALGPGLVMGVMIIPTIASLSEDSIYCVPQHLREAAYGLGARKYTTIMRVTLPAAASGIVAAIALAVGRAVGETMIVAIAAGQRPQLTFDPRVPIETMTAFIVQVSMGDTPQGTLEYRSIFVVGASLFLVTLLINFAGRFFSRRFARE